MDTVCGGRSRQDPHPDAAEEPVRRGSAAEKLGIDWIEDNTMRDVILRHLPELEPMVHKQNAFAPWTPVEIQKGLTPSVAPNLKPKRKPHHATDRRVAE